MAKALVNSALKTLHESFQIVKEISLPPLAERLRHAFPEVDPGVRPLGSRVLCQIRRPKLRSEGGVHFSDDSKEAEKWNEMTAKVIAVGPLAFCSRTTGEPWIEGKWVKPGDFVRIPMHGGDRIERPVPDDTEPALFVTVNDLEVVSVVTGNPLDLKTYL